MCATKTRVKEARRRVGLVLTRLGLELHPEKTVDLSRGRQGFDFLEERLHAQLGKRAESRVRAGRTAVWIRPFFEALRLYRLRGTIQYPGAA